MPGACLRTAPHCPSRASPGISRSLQALVEPSSRRGLTVDGGRAPDGGHHVVVGSVGRKVPDEFDVDLEMRCQHNADSGRPDAGRHGRRTRHRVEAVRLGLPGGAVRSRASVNPPVGPSYAGAGAGTPAESLCRGRRTSDRSPWWRCRQPAITPSSPNQLDVLQVAMTTMADSARKAQVLAVPDMT